MSEKEKEIQAGNVAEYAGSPIGGMLSGAVHRDLDHEKDDVIVANLDGQVISTRGSWLKGACDLSQQDEYSEEDIEVIVYTASGMSFDGVALSDLKGAVIEGVHEQSKEHFDLTVEQGFGVDVLDGVVDLYTGDPGLGTGTENAETA